MIMSKESEAKAAEAKAQEQADQKAKQEADAKAAAEAKAQEQADQKAQQEADAKAAAEAKAQEQADQKDAKIAELSNRIKAMEEAAKGAKGESAPVRVAEKPAQQRYEELPYSATVVYECDGPDTKTVDGESEVVSTKLQPSCTKGHWETMPRWEKGSKKGQPTHLTNARLIGFIEGGELVKL
jgi:flagellar biosynthesis GTPase FlhF